MFMGVRLLSKEEFENFLKELKELESNPASTQEQIYNKKLELESHLKIFGASAIEDKLQENLKETIEVLKLAGMKIWVITGDKQETAKNIAYASGLFEKDKEPEYMTEETLQKVLKIHAEKEKKKEKEQKPIWRWRTDIGKKIKIPHFNEVTPHQGIPQLTA